MWAVFIIALTMLVTFFAPTATTQETNPFEGETLYLNTDHNPARETADEWYLSGRTADAQQLEKIAKTPTSKWFSRNSTSYEDYLSRAESAGQLPVLTLYAIPYRDCGSYSAGGLPASDYREFIDDVTSSIGDQKAVTVLEPDALPQLGCLSAELQQERLDLLNYAVDKLKSNPSTYVYIDAGNPEWHSEYTMINRLQKAGIGKADGFSLNVSGYGYTSDHITYGKKLSAGVGGKHFVIDTSRNGNGSYEGGTHSEDCPSWANPPGRALGERAGYDKPTEPLLDAYLWIKYPGESDADCGGYPPAGSWMPEYALELANNAKFAPPDEDPNCSVTTTTVQGDTKAPTVCTMLPTRGQTNAQRNVDAKASFSKRMNSSTLETDPTTQASPSVKLYERARKSWLPVRAQVSYDAANKTVTVNPYGTSEALLGANRVYLVTINTEAKDLVGNALATNEYWYFRTGSY